MNSIKGTVVLKKKIRKTDYLWGPIEDIAGKELTLIEQDKKGNCLCVVGITGIVEVSSCDIKKINYNDLHNPYSNMPIDAQTRVFSMIDGFLKARRKGLRKFLKEEQE